MTGSTQAGISLEEQMAALQRRTQCPLAEGKLFIFVQAMDPYQRRQIVLECPAKRLLLKDAQQWKVYQEEIERVCCSPRYAEECTWYVAAHAGR
ncbi:MAG: hypothetical protein N2595_03585 [bacterium]|nr:hypothetical protein [bacterium]